MTDPEYREAYMLHKDMLYRFAYRMIGSPVAAEDVVQDCFVVLLRNPLAYDRERGTLRSFLIGVTRNLALKRLRADRIFDHLEESAACMSVDTDLDDRAGLIAQAIASLPPLQRETLILAEYEEMALDEIARVVGSELAAVKSRLHRARENLRRMLAPLLETKGTVYGSRR